MIPASLNPDETIRSGIVAFWLPDSSRSIDWAGRIEQNPDQESVQCDLDDCPLRTEKISNYDSPDRKRRQIDKESVS